MSARLHIPLTHHQKTTSRPRWVVWLLSAFILISVLFFMHVSTLWFTRNTVFVAAPEGTQFAIQLNLNQKTLPAISKILDTIPLISNRHFTLKDVQSFTKGEIGWFFSEDGQSSLAIRAKKTDLPSKILDANQIIVQQVGQNVFLLTDKLQPVSGIKSRRSFSSFIPSFKQKLGQYYEQGQKIRNIYTNKEGITIPLSNKSVKNIFDIKDLQENTYIAIKTPVVSAMSIDIYQSLFPDTDLFRSFFTENGFILMKDIENPKFLIVSEAKMEEKKRIEFLQTAIALKNPTIITKTLPDNTQTQELVSDPSLISVEEKIIEGKEFLRVSNNQESLFESKSEQIILSNDEETIRNWLKKDDKQKMLKFCNANVAFISLSELIKTNSFTTQFYTNDTLRFLASRFSVASIEKGWNSTKFHLCY
ncbi:hypothetical protein HY771_01065 [Candidatus Uhrbacteria bacterium]|nr:hypothetical protein [Candidatus Uhrbacteria bacterium]